LEISFRDASLCLLSLVGNVLMFNVPLSVSTQTKRGVQKDWSDFNLRSNRVPS
jgi:hypothetical protein